MHAHIDQVLPRLRDGSLDDLLDKHVDIVTAEWRESLEGIFRTGIALENAKLELKKVRGAWSKFFDPQREKHAPFSIVAAKMLILVANDPNVRNRNYSNALPVSWRTLYELTQLDDETFESAIADGRINPEMKQKDARKLHSPKCEKVETKTFTAVERCALKLRTLALKTAREFSPQERADLVEVIHDIANDLQRVFATWNAEERHD